LPSGFWKWHLKERRAFFVKEAIVNHTPIEIIPNDLLCGARFNMMASHCLSKAQTRKRNRQVYGARGVRKAFLD
ncbi:MAG: hypothetical protein WC251_03880, partial [Candidatus Izemoplasmatales bacterium]